MSGHIREALVERVEVIDVAVPTEQLLRAPSRRLAHPGCLLGVIEQAGDRLGKCVAVVSLDKDPRLTVGDHFRQASDPSCHDRAGHEGGFQGHQAEPLDHSRWHQDDRRRIEKIRHLLKFDPAEKINTVGEAQPSDLSFEDWPSRSDAGNRQPRFWKPMKNVTKRRDSQIEPLPVDKPSQAQQPGRIERQRRWQQGWRIVPMVYNKGARSDARRESARLSKHGRRERVHAIS